MEITVGLSTFGATYVAQLTDCRVHERTGNRNFEREFLAEAVEGRTWAKSYGRKALSTGAGTATIPPFSGIYEVQDWPTGQKRRRRYYRVTVSMHTGVQAEEVSLDEAILGAEIEAAASAGALFGDRDA